VNPQIAISAGEASGDLYGANLATHVKELLPDARLFGGGGRRMRESGVELVIDTTGGGTMGVAQSLKTLPAILAKYLHLKREIIRRKPDLFVPIDFGAFNVRLAKALYNHHGTNVVYYFPPSSWRRRPRNAGELRECGGKVVTPFPWSADFLRAEGVDARFVGHPILDMARPTRSRDEFLRFAGLSPSYRTIGLFLGSRSHEIASHFGPAMECARILNERLCGAQFVVGAVGNAEGLQRRVDRWAASRPGFPTVRVVEGAGYDCMAYSDVLVVTSGTATMEAAIIGTPMVIIYRGTWMMQWEFVIRNYTVESFIGMPNIIAGREICPEIIGTAVTGERLADEVVAILTDPEKSQAMCEDFKLVRGELGEPGGTVRAARAILELGGLL
jgi:lipid-A-disaccharide synthase